MAILEHSTLPNASVHEPKHITTNGTTSSGKVITSSSTTTATSEYRRLTQGDIDGVEILWMVATLDATTSDTLLIPATFNGEITNISGVTDLAMLTGSNSYKMTIDAVDVTSSAHTFDLVAGTGGTPGDIVDATPTAANAFSDGSLISLESTAIANTAAAVIRWVITCVRT